MGETELQSAILDTLRRVFPWSQWARNNTGRRGRVSFGLGKGSPDLIGCVNGRMVCLEVKTDDGKVSAAQAEWHLRWSAAGAHVEVVRSGSDALAAVQRSQETA